MKRRALRLWFASQSGPNMCGTEISPVPSFAVPPPLSKGADHRGGGGVQWLVLIG